MKEWRDRRGNEGVVVWVSVKKEVLGASEKRDSEGNAMIRRVTIRKEIGK